MTRPTPLMRNAFEASKDGYSFERYGETAWMANIRWLCSKGLGADQIAALMNSKLTRWAADEASDRELDDAVARYAVRFPRDFLKFLEETKS